MATLVISVRFHDGRYHGRPEWPPSPARLFQALVAGAARGARLDDDDKRALEWLQAREPPVIAAPAMRRGQGFRNYVPNNDLDAVGGDPRRVAEIRAPKLVRPILFDAETPLLYLWRFADGDDSRNEAMRLCAMAEHLHQLGRGVDMAWARGETLEDAEADARLAAHGGAVHRPSRAGGGTPLAAPVRGSFASLVERHRRMRTRFHTVHEAKPSRKEPDRKVAAGQVFAQPPQPLFREVPYDSPSSRWLFDLAGPQAPWRLDRIAELTERVRDAAARKLSEALPAEAETIRNVVVGRRDAEDADKGARLRIMPLPSIGHRHADHAIRRVLVESPANCPLRAGELEWAFSGLPVIVSDDGEVFCELVVATDHGMLDHYGVGDGGADLWRTVTPAALPVARRRIDPRRRTAGAKGGAERAAEESQAVSAVVQALRHAGIAARPSAVRVQREPFEAHGARAEAFAPGTRFPKERLWHVEIAFDAPRGGPLLVGDGRYLGLGLMRPERRADGVLAFAVIEGAAPEASAPALTHALRRAVLARVQAELGAGQPLPSFFTGHESDGASARSGRHEHLSFAYDAARRRLLIIAPHALEHRSPGRGEARNWSRLARAMEGFEDLRAGRAGRLRLIPAPFDREADPLSGPARRWESATAYSVTRHRKCPGAAAALAADIEEECCRLHLPRPDVEVVRTEGIPGAGLAGRARLRFAVAVRGPILIGRDRHFGGGLFVGR